MVEKEKERSKDLIINLTFDEISIEKKIEWSGKTFVGNIDLGTGIEPDDSFPQASEALVFMVVARDKSWKLSIGYYLTSGLSAEEK
jgi:hypothetical protein